MEDEISVKDLVNKFQKRVKADYDAVVAITGEEGSGKSCLANNIIEEYLKRNCETREELLEEFQKYLIFSPNKEKVKKTIKNAPKYSIINADEAVKILYKQNWASPVQKFLNMLYAVARQENLVSILCMPRFMDFNEFFRNHRIKYWLYILDRGTAVFCAKDWNPFSDDPWLIKENNKYIKSLSKRKSMYEFTTEDKINTFHKLPIYVGIVRFDDMAPDLKKVYKKYKRKYSYEDMEEQTRESIQPGRKAEWYSDKLKNLVSNLKKYSVMNNTEISKITGISRNTVREWQSDNDNEQSPNSNKKDTKEELKK
ncbi:MAG: ATP-binding protein [Bacteroidales bacterium]